MFDCGSSRLKSSAPTHRIEKFIGQLGQLLVRWAVKKYLKSLCRLITCAATALQHCTAIRSTDRPRKQIRKRNWPTATSNARKLQQGPEPHVLLQRDHLAEMRPLLCHTRDVRDSFIQRSTLLLHRSTCPSRYRCRHQPWCLPRPRQASTWAWTGVDVVMVAGVGYNEDFGRRQRLVSKWTARSDVRARDIFMQSLSWV